MAGAIQAILNFRENMSQGLRNIAGQSEENQRQIRLLDNRVQDFKKSATSNFINVAKTVGGLSAAFIGLNAAGATISGSIDSVKDYSKALTQLQSSTGETGKEFTSLKNEMKSLYAQNFGESWGDVGESLATVAQITGKSGTELETSTKNALLYREVFKADLPESIKVTDTMMKQFGISSTEAFNLLAQGQQSGLDKSGELLDSVNEYSNQFKGLGFNANEMFDLFAAGLDSGAFNLDKVGDAVKEFGIRSKDASTGSMDAFKALGFDAKKMTATFAGGGQNAKKAFTQVMQAIDKVKDPVKKVAIGTALLGTQFEDLGPSAVTALANVENGFNGATDTMGKLNEIRYTDLDTAIGGIKRTLETSIVTPLADKVLPKLGELTTWVKSKTPAIKKGIDDAFKTGKDLMNDFGDAMDWAKKNADWLVPAVAAVTGAVVAQMAVNGVTGLITAYKAWRATTAGLTLAQAGLNAVMAMSPLGWIAIAIGAVIGVGVLLWKNWDTVKAKASELWSWISGVWTNLKEGTINAFNGVKDSVAGTFSSMVGAVKTPINSIIDMINNLIGKINGISIEFPEWMPGDLGGKSFGLNIPTIPTFAKGTNNAPGGISLVGEEGPELVNLKKGSTVTTADKTKKILAANSSGTKIEINIGNVYGEEDFMDRVVGKLVNILDNNLSNVVTT